MSKSWRDYREDAIIRRRREGRRSPGNGLYINYPLAKPASASSYGFYARWAFDNVIEMLCRAETEEEKNLASVLYSVLYDADTTLGFLARYQLGATAPSSEGEDNGLLPSPKLPFE